MHDIEKLNELIALTSKLKQVRFTCFDISHKQNEYVFIQSCAKVSTLISYPHDVNQ
jgi:hypothetical protein